MKEILEDPQVKAYFEKYPSDLSKIPQNGRFKFVREPQIIDKLDQGKI